MLVHWIDSILPGARNFRPPLISGLLWTVLLWIIFGERIPSPNEAEGWIAQAYSLSSVLGIFPTSIVIVVIIWVIGVMSIAATMPVATVTGSALLSIKRYIMWQYHAIRFVHQLRSKLASLKQKQEALSKDKDSQEKELTRIDKQIEEIQTKLRRVSQSTFLGFIIFRNGSMISVLNYHRPDRAEEISEYLVRNVAYEALDEAIQKNPKDHVPDSVRIEKLLEIETEFLQEFDPDPLDALRAIDEKLYLELDRERSEREVRLAASLPIIAFGSVGFFVWCHWFIVVLLLGILLFSNGSMAQSFERSRIMKLVGLKGIHTPALRSAMVAGRNALRHYNSKNDTKTER